MPLFSCVTLGKLAPESLCYHLCRTRTTAVQLGVTVPWINRAYAKS